MPLVDHFCDGTSFVCQIYKSGVCDRDLIFFTEIFHGEDVYKRQMFKYQWGLLNKESGLDINILPLWNYIKKTNVGIGIADTGINYNHCCLKNYVNPYLAYDFVVNRKEDSKGYCEYDLSLIHI